MATKNGTVFVERLLSLQLFVHIKQKSNLQLPQAILLEMYVDFEFA